MHGERSTDDPLNPMTYLGSYHRNFWVPSLVVLH
jgi:hypothetical protein